MSPTPPGPRGDDEVDALVTDEYLDGLLTGGERPDARGERPDAHVERPDAHGELTAAEKPAGQPLRDADAPIAIEPDTDLRRAGDVLRAALVRVHPSFRFEERLADRLAELAASRATRAVVGGEPAEVIPFPGTDRPGADDPLLQAVLDGRLDPADGYAVARAAGLRSPARPLILGGAITSAAISLVGVAWVAWRASRPGTTPMSRAVRTAHGRRLADVPGLAQIPGGPA